MTLFTIDETLCDRDAHCVENCPRLIIEMADERSVPAPVDGADELCIDCGHCVAVCPEAALVRDDVPLPPALDDQSRPSTEQLLHFLRSRRSARRSGHP